MLSARWTGLALTSELRLSGPVGEVREREGRTALSWALSFFEARGPGLHFLVTGESTLAPSLAGDRALLVNWTLWPLNHFICAWGSC